METVQLVHVSQMATRKIVNAKEVVKRDQQVYVKVISVSGSKLSLSMRDVDQHIGKDLLPLKKSSEEETFRTNPQDSKDGPVARTWLSGIRTVEEDDVGSWRRPLKRMSYPDIWEVKQLIVSGVLSVSEYPSYDDEGDGVMYQEEGAEEELEIEMNDDEPAFLQGQTRSSMDMSPVKIFKVRPDHQ
ncbi:RNA helicase [Trifolium repens]|nr:RNA helicase [Trifolium repens]